MDDHPASKWADLFDQACHIIDQANSEITLIDSWTFGGGTALMLQIDHRESFDVDIFLDDPQLLPYLNPRTQGYTLDINPDGYETDGSRTLKIVFENVGEIDFICAPRLTDNPTVKAAVAAHGRSGGVLDAPCYIQTAHRQTGRDRPFVACRDMSGSWRSSPEDPEYAKTLRWCGGCFDPAWFDLLVVEKDHRNARRSNVKRRH